jgi:hypothetical protein
VTLSGMFADGPHRVKSRVVCRRPARRRPGLAEWSDWRQSLAHAEMNVLAGLGFRKFSDLVLTTTLEPRLQCAAAMRLGPVSTVRFTGQDRDWEGSPAFSKLSAREAARAPVTRISPRRDALGLLATLISLTGPALTRFYEEALPLILQDKSAQIDR